ncbi:DUF998 domain-containing protein [Micromonospora sp. NPDC000089]|uniref:DUF998 domain-containing protein n=1 Tax=unclassified Micromonospora TaxID=2617518 RepID=UPI0036CAEC89
MRPVPRWALVSAALAPILLIGGWMLAAARQPGGFDQVSGTISALAARDAADRWVMTLALAGLGLCHCVTAAGLRPVRSPGRLLLALGGIATIAVAASPLPSGGGSSTAHGVAAAVAFGALALWPALAGPARRPAGTAAPASPGTTTGSSPGPGAAGRGRAAGHALAALLLILVGWFVVELTGGGGWIGLTERLTAGAEAVAPLLVVAVLSRPDRPAAGGSPAPAPR